MKLKWVYLFLAFFLPIGLTFFLQFFGKSEFNIPVYYEQGISTDSLPGCQFNYTKPYVIADSVLKRLSRNSKGAMLITTDSSVMATKNFDRIKEEIDYGQFTFVTLTQEKSDPLVSCILFLNKSWTTILIDDQKRIRGYYAPASREEADRLIAEMKILLKDY